MTVTALELKELLGEIGMRPEVVQAVDPARPLLAQGVDSADYPAFAALLEERFGLDMDEAEGRALRTLEDFAAFLNAGGLAL